MKKTDMVYFIEGISGNLHIEESTYSDFVRDYADCLENKDKIDTETFKKIVTQEENEKTGESEELDVVMLLPNGYEFILANESVRKLIEQEDIDFVDGFKNGEERKYWRLYTPNNSVSGKTISYHKTEKEAEQALFKSREYDVKENRSGYVPQLFSSKEKAEENLKEILDDKKAEK